MANAEAKYIKTVILTLDEEESSVLLQICGSIGGIPDGPRGVFDRISKALEKVDVTASSYDYDGVARAIYFKL